MTDYKIEPGDIHLGSLTPSGAFIAGRRSGKTISTEQSFIDFIIPSVSWSFSVSHVEFRQFFGLLPTPLLYEWDKVNRWGQS